MPSVDVLMVGIVYFFCLENHTLFDVNSTSYDPIKRDKSDCNYRNTGKMECEYGTDIICVSTSY